MLIFAIVVLFFVQASLPQWYFNQNDWNACHLFHGPGQFGCNCRNTVFTTRQKSIDLAWVCDGFPDCDNGEDETDCICRDDEFQCNDCTREEKCADGIPYYQCIPLSQVGDGEQNCISQKDDPQTFWISSCVKDWYCNGNIDCDWMTPNDEENCTCPSNYLPNRCDCNQEGNYTCKIDPTHVGRYTCYHPNWKCSGHPECTDSSDEIGCQCFEGQFTCDCITKLTCTKNEGCISIYSALENGFINCPNVRVPFGNFGRILIHDLNNISECENIGFPQCDNSTCYEYNFAACSGSGCISSHHAMCTSYCSDKQYCHRKPVFQCNDNSYIFLDHFCDGTVDCVDGSDEIINQPGFKCNECVLPQNNLFDDVAQCDDKLDLCLDENVSCFQCFDKRLLISSKQVCNGVNDCFDMSDECLCDTNIEKEQCKNMLEKKIFLCFENENIVSSRNSLTIHVTSIQSKTNNILQSITCRDKFGSIRATLCDGRPECIDYSDECQCNNPPSFCNDTCRTYFPMGDRYCDGVEDPAWAYINDSACPKGFDERWCPKRFKCNATGNFSIDVLKVCDGKADCDDKSDETNCSVKEDETLFSSDTDMIANPALRSAFWVIGVLVIVANAYVIFNTTALIKRKNMSDALRLQHVIILNVSFADLIMGVYLLTIAAYSVIFSGRYGLVDQEWRSSLKCSIIGSLSILSSETSCFFMVVLTAFRLVNISKPMKSLTLNLLPWKLCVAAVWLLSLSLSIAPMLDVTSSYFVHSIWFSSRFFQNGTVNVAKLKMFMCSVASISNTTIRDYGNELKSIEMFLKHNFPDSASVRMFGYYGETSVCLPRFYAASGDRAWEFTLFLITINFLCFLFIAISYVFIFKLSFRSSAEMRTSKSDKQSTKMQKRIARIIATDFFCWIPICIMAYVRLQTNFSNIVYEISAVVLLPINSALNPFLFSSLPDKVANLCRCKYLK